MSKTSKNNRLSKSRFTKSIKFWLGIISGIIFFYFAVRGTEFYKVMEVMRQTFLFPLLVSLILRVFGLWMRGLRWHFILKPLKLITPNILFRIIGVGELGNYLLPIRIGEVIRIMMIAKKESISKTSALASIFVERFLDLLTILIFFSFFSIFISFPKLIQGISYLAGFILSIVTIGCIVFLNCHSHIEKLLQTIFCKFPKFNFKLQQVINYFSQGLIIMGNIRKLMGTALFSLILWGIYSAALFFVFLGLKLDLPWYSTFVTISCIGIAQAIPSSAGYLGTTEFFSVTILTAFSLDKSTALACTLVSHALQYLAVIGVGLSSYLWEYYHFHDVNLHNGKITQVD